MNQPVTIAVQLPPGTRRKLARLSRQSGLSPAKIIRQAVARELADMEMDGSATDGSAARPRDKMKTIRK
jgi:predicted DNA-binding protein